MNKQRTTQLLKNAMECFDKNMSPFSHEQLSRNNVTAEECGELSYMIGAIIQSYISEDLLPPGLPRYTISLLKTKKQIAKTRDIVAEFGMETVDMPQHVLKVAVKTTDDIREDMGFLMNFVRLDVLRQITSTREIE